MPDTCAQCRAFLVSGRPDCPFCGAEAAAREAAAPAAPTAPDPRTSAGAPSSWLAPGATAANPGPPPLPPRSNRSVGNLGMVLGAVAAIAAIGALIAFMPDPGKKRGPQAEAKAEALTPVEQLEGVCAGKPVPIKGAKAFDGKPGPHRVEAVLLDPRNLAIQLANYGRIHQPDGWGSPEEEADLTFEKVELVGCYVIDKADMYMVCDYQGGLTQERWVLSGRLVVREAKTGKEVLRQPIAPVEAYESCPLMAMAGEETTYDTGTHGVIDVLRIFTGKP